MSRRRRGAWLTATACAVASLAALAAGTGALGAGAAPSPAVSWSVDDASKTITVTVTMAFFSGTSTGYDEASSLTVNHILASILNDWNGHSFECYQLVVKINSSVVSGQSDVPANAIGVRIDPPASGVRADTATSGGSDSSVSTSPSDRPDPTTGPDDPSTWPEDMPPSVYAHEFGHILGLDESYDPYAENSDGDIAPVLQPGMAGDVMFAANPATANTVSEDSINRAVERSGQVDTSKLDCNMTLDAGPSSQVGMALASISGMKIHAWTCNYHYQSNDPKSPPQPMTWQGTVTYSYSTINGKHGQVSVPTSGLLTTTVKKTGVLDFVLPPGASGNLHISAPFVWTNDGLVQATEPFSFGVGGGSAGLANALVQVPSLTATVTHGASECGGR